MSTEDPVRRYEQRVAALREACASTVAFLSEPRVENLWTTQSVLAGYTVGGIVGHLVSAVARIESLLDDPAPPDAPRVGLAEFYGANRIADPSDNESGLHPVVRRHGEDQARVGINALRDELAGVSTRTVPRLQNTDPALLVPVLQVRGSATTVSDYVATRVVELVVHTDDLAISCDTDFVLSRLAADVVIDVCVELVRAHGDLEVIRGLTRRERATPSALWAL